MDGNEKLYDFVARSKSASLLCLDPSRTVQSEMNETDINVIVKRFNVSGEMPIAHGRIPNQYIDVDGELDFATAYELVQDAERAFMEYPASFRAKFENDPIAFADWATDPANIGELRELGLAPPAALPENTGVVAPATEPEVK